MKFEIKSWYDGKILFSVETDNWKLAVEAAIKSKADLSYADLRYADLSYADLRSADLSSANLRSADLSSANLRYADLRSADLRSANLRYADLSYADLRYADLSSANLRSANLRYADLRYADLSYAKGIKDFMSIGRIGSRNDCLIAIMDEKDEIKIIAGCWSGTIEQFEARVKEVYGKNKHGLDYMAAIKLIKQRMNP